ncbi:MAG: RNA-guided pseudouridylation complex pseudouridine synthase subunit Cbf5 [archaeon]
MDKLPFERDRELLVRHEEETSAKHGTLPTRRSVEQLLNNGVVNIDKPAGPTSHEVCEWVKRILKSSKTGHAGTLDPNVTGILVVGLGNATKALQALLHAGKEYVCLMHLHEPVDEAALRVMLGEFTGKIYQRPPEKAAVKRILRAREIYYNKIIEIDGKDVLFKTGCEAGTYIRRLCYDLGAALGVGAHMQQLRRTKTAAFDESSIVSLQSLTDAYVDWKENGDEKELRKIVHPMEKALTHLPKIIVSDYAVDALCHGAQLALPGLLKMDSGIEKGELVACFTQKGEAVVMGKALMSSEAMEKTKKGLAIKTERVFMDEGVYPSYKK